jgi:exodeoxyribonuclease V alpha subunit
MATLTPTAAHVEFALFIEAGVFTVAEIHAAEVIVNTVFAAAQSSPQFLDYLSVAIAVWAPTNGHVCADLSTIASRVANEYRPDVDGSVATRAALQWPDTNSWVNHLSSSPLVGKPNLPDPSNRQYDVTHPLVLDGARLYLTRQWIDECDVAAMLWSRFTQPVASDIHVSVEDINTQLQGKLTDEQTNAVLNALTHNTTVLLGGPGTGKTYTITAILHMLFREHAQQKDVEGPLSVALVAPTAKASRQIGNSIDTALTLDGFPKDFVEDLSRIGQEAGTIHRLLGTNFDNRGRFRHNRRHYLPYKVVIVDEVSMVSLSLMSRLLEALAPTTRLILVGDGEQLKSVENGAVLPEIAQLRDSTAPFPITTLTKNQRQLNEETGELNEIGKLAELMRHPDSSEDGKGIGGILDLLRTDSELVTWIELSSVQPEPLHQENVLDLIQHDLKKFAEARVHSHVGKASDALVSLAQVRVLCGHRKGRYGVSEWNRAISQMFDISLDRSSIGLPLLNTKNDLRTGLVNGDNGIIVLVDGQPHAVFSVTAQVGSADEQETAKDSQLRYFEPTSLDNVEVAFATTVHKAQGSQYETAVVVCPPEESPLATRELIYTAATRATTRLVIIADEVSLAKAINTRTMRESALAERIIQFTTMKR